jgi:hypothetical protein
MADTGKTSRRSRISSQHDKRHRRLPFPDTLIFRSVSASIPLYAGIFNPRKIHYRPVNRNLTPIHVLNPNRQRPQIKGNKVFESLS